MEEKVNLTFEEKIKVPKLKKRLSVDLNMIHEISHEPDLINKTAIENKSIFNDKLQLNDCFIKRYPQTYLIQTIVSVLSIVFGLYAIYHFNYRIGAVIFGFFL